MKPVENSTGTVRAGKEEGWEWVERRVRKGERVKGKIHGQVEGGWKGGIKQQRRPDSFPRIGLGNVGVKVKQPERTGAHAAVSWEPAQETPSY